MTNSAFCCVCNLNHMPLAVIIILSTCSPLAKIFYFEHGQIVGWVAFTQNWLMEKISWIWIRSETFSCYKFNMHKLQYCMICNEFLMKLCMKYYIKDMARFIKVLFVFVNLGLQLFPKCLRHVIFHSRLNISKEKKKRKRKFDCFDGGIEEVKCQVSINRKNFFFWCLCLVKNFLKYMFGFRDS